MDILIKSFNRAYYLDRCLYSIIKYVKNFNGKIIVLDDGTPQIFLKKIKEKYPNIIIEKSEFYEKKQALTSKGFKPISYEIPIKLWVDAAKKASDYFILIEDDTWFIEDIDIEDVEKELIENNVALSKLYWIGNPKINLSKKAVSKRNLVLISPKLFTKIPVLYNFIFYKFTKFKIRRILQILRINTFDRQLAYYTIYAVAGVIFKRDYFIKLWKNHQNSIDENLQKYNAVKIFFKRKEKYTYAHHKKEILKTGFISSATNQYKEHYKGNVDMFIFNKILNQAWLEGSFNTIKSLPNDLDSKDIFEALEADKYKTILYKNWLSWSNNFKKQYLDKGCVID
ncbi:hypothetical protein [uncultured Flavobacterium sp.]|uniref:hypothetical protein n=1 Tax=uncultured Flavobacterium sp. TaxID=165435 RepID=UPI0030CA2791|tara:strand:- start:1795 stop:2814 length:1020 start_codon:yes stop_codon:yes gene_type:complete